MPAARYDGDLIIQLRGNKDLARQYVGEARKVMGYVLQDAEANGLGVHMVKRYANDGTEIIAEKIGDLKRVRITPPGGPGRKKPVRIFEDLVLGLIDTRIGGANVNVSPIIFSPQEEDVLDWRAYFYNEDEPSFYEGAGSYGDVFPRANDLTRRQQLPAGNINWYDADGYYCSWLSAVTHLTPPGRHPENMYGARVVALGRSIVDMRIYEFATSSFSNHKVLAACIRNKHVYIMASQLGQLYYTPRPPVVPDGDAWASEKHAQDPFDYVLLRIPLAEVEDPVSGQLYYKAINEADEILWSGTLERAYSAWRFSTDGRRLVNVQLPTSGFLIWKNMAFSSTVVNDSVVHEILISSEGDSASMGTYAADNVIYDDGDATLELERVGSGAFDYVSGSQRWPAVRSTPEGFSVRRIVHADPRNGRFFIMERTVEFTGIAPVDNTYVMSDVTEREIVLEEGVETYLYEHTENRAGARRPDTSVAQNYLVYGYSLAFGAINVGGPGGYYAGAVGVTDYVFGPIEGWPGFLYADMPLQDTTLIAPMYYYTDAEYGFANGGMSFSRHHTTEVSSPPTWSPAHVGYGKDNSITPEYALQTSVRIDSAGVSNARYMFVQGNSAYYFAMTSADPRWNYRPTYLTDGDYEALANIPVENTYIIDAYILGKPLKAQKYNIPVLTP